MRGWLESPPICWLRSASAGWISVLGVSYGEAIAQELAYRHPEHVRRLVLAPTMRGLGGVPGKPQQPSPPGCWLGK